MHCLPSDLVRVHFGWHLRLKLQDMEDQVFLALLVISVAEI